MRLNHLYNPFGDIASPWDTTNTAVGITLGGTLTTNPVASTTYTVNGVDVVMYCSGGTLGTTKPAINVDHPSRDGRSPATPRSISASETPSTSGTSRGRSRASSSASN